MVRAAITLHKQRNVKKAPKTPKYFLKFYTGMFLLAEIERGVYDFQIGVRC